MLVAEVSIRPFTNSKYYFRINNLDLNPKDLVVVTTISGIEVGRVLQLVKINQSSLTDELGEVIRVCDDNDLRKLVELEKEENLIVKDIKSEVKRLDLNMKITKAHYSFDQNDLTIFFEADGRVDFRELVRNVNNKYNLRVELRQIGSRDTAKLLGGVGPCGLILCCASFIGDFETVSIKMAKNQNLTLTPSRISGMCGKLLCCIKFEDEVYEELKINLPDVGEVVKSDKGKAQVIGVNILGQKVRLKYFGSEGIEWVSLIELSTR